MSGSLTPSWPGCQVTWQHGSVESCNSSQGAVTQRAPHPRQGKLEASVLTSPERSLPCSCSWVADQGLSRSRVKDSQSWEVPASTPAQQEVNPPTPVSLPLDGSADAEPHTQVGSSSPRTPGQPGLSAAVGGRGSVGHSDWSIIGAGYGLLAVGHSGAPGQE